MKSSRLLTSLLALSVFSLCAAREWITTSTDTVTHSIARKWLTMQTLAVDSSGDLHAVWTEVTDTSLKSVMYARKPFGTAWTEPEVVAETVNNHAAIAVEKKTGAAHITWTVQFGTTADVFYATNRTGQWVRTRLTEDALGQWLPTIALEADTAPHIAWVARDSTDAYHITYSTKRSGTWQTQMLAASELGGFGSGAAPWLAVSPEAIAHITYRGGDYPAYRIHHAENASPGDTTWAYEILTTVNTADYTSAVRARDSGELYLVASGDDGWGSPFRTCYLHRPPNSNQWETPVLMTASASAAMRGFTTDGDVVHATWEEINVNINTAKIFHVSNVSGLWYNSAIRDDGRTSFGAIAVDGDHSGHCLVLVDSAVKSDSQQIVCVHSEPFTAVAEPDARLLLPRVNATLHRLPGHVLLPELAVADVRVCDAAGREVRRLAAGCARWWDGTDQAGRTSRAGIYLLMTDKSSRPIIVLR